MNMLVRSTAAVVTASFFPVATSLAADNDPDARLHELAAAIVADDDEVSAACDRLAPCEQVMFAWRHENPRPQMPERPPVLIPEDWRNAPDRALTITISGDRAEERAVHQRACRLWRRREARKERSCGYRAAVKHQKTCMARQAGLVREMEATPAKTIAGLHCKARVAQLLDWDGDITTVIAQELLSLAG